MKRSEIKVGQVYGVRSGIRRHDPVVQAEVVSLNAPYSVMGSWSAREYDHGGVKVKFLEPVRGSAYYFAPMWGGADAPDALPEYTFKDSPQVGKHFVGLWSDLEAERLAEEAHQAEYEAHWDKEADEFAPVLDAYRDRLAAIGLPVETHLDFSGLYGPGIKLRLGTTDWRPDGTGNRPASFGHEVKVDKAVFDRLIEIAEKHGEVLS